MNGGAHARLFCSCDTRPENQRCRDALTRAYRRQSAREAGDQESPNDPRRIAAGALDALELLPVPKAAAQNGSRYFSSETASLRSLVKGAERLVAAVFKRSGVERAHCHGFRHTLATGLLAKGGTFESVAAILGATPATIRRYYANWTPEYQSRQDELLRLVHGTDLA